MKLSSVFSLIGIKDGENVEYMELVTAPSTISVSQFNVQKTPLSIELVHRSGASTTPHEGFIQVRAKSGDVAISGTEHVLGTCSRTSYTIAANNMSLASATSIVVEAFNNAQKEVLLASAEVPINVYGNVDAVYRDFKWSNPPVWTDLPVGTSFRNGDYFDIEKNSQSNIYMWACRVEGITTKAPFDPTISPEEAGCWEHVTEKTLFATKMLLAKSALLGSAVFNGDWTISQHGVSTGTNPDTGKPFDYRDFDAAMTKFNPNLAIDWRNGKVFGKDIDIQGGKIGNLRVVGDKIINEDFRTPIEIGIDKSNDEKSTCSYLAFGGSANDIIKVVLGGGADKRPSRGLVINSFGEGNVGLEVVSNAGSRFAMRSAGAHYFYQRKGEIWHAPGVLYAGHFGADGTKHYEWGQGAGEVTCKPDGVGNYRIFHKLNMEDYFVHITPYTYWAFATPQSKENNTFWFTITEGGHLKSLEFDVIIYGRPVYKDYFTDVVR